MNVKKKISCQTPFKGTMSRDFRLPSKLVAKFSAGVFDIGGKFAAGVVDIGSNFAAGVIDTVADTGGAV
jgi:hypothetical protein